jgi:muramidase (phage lysozyme)
MADNAGTVAQQEKNVEAFLHVIRWAEFYPSGDRDSDYTTMYGGDSFTDTSDHPRTKVTKWHHTSTAAGAYMILEGTWDEIQKKLNLPDFSAASQDKMALELIRRRHALGLIQEGKFDAAVAKLRLEWSSLPGASQSRVTLQQAQQKFIESGGTIADDGKKTK